MTNPLLAGLRDGAWLDAQNFPPLRYAVPGIIPEGSTLLVGPPKIGKSWFVLACALAKAAGGYVLGSIRLAPAPTLYLALEDGDLRLKSRCRELLGAEPIPPAFEYLTRVEPGTVIETIAAWLTAHRGSSPLIVLDTLGKVMPPAQPGESAYQRDYRIGSALKRITDTEPGLSLITNHHDRKAASEDFVDAVSGTHGLAGAADTTVVLARARDQADGLIKVTGRDVPEGEYTLRFDAGSRWLLDGRDLADAARNARERLASVGLGDRSVDVIRFVADHPDVGPTEVARALGMEPNNAGTYLTRLATAGRIEKAARGKYRPIGGVETVESVETGDRGEPEKFHTSTLSTPPSVSDDPLCQICNKDLLQPASIERGICASCEPAAA